MLGRVRQARAKERRAAGAAAAERAALEDAAHQLHAACELMSLLDPRVLESIVLRTQVAAPAGRAARRRHPARRPRRPRRHDSGRPADPLDEAERSLTTLLDQWPSGEQVPGEVYAARGGVLLDQARRAAARDPQGPDRAAVRTHRARRSAALRAADDLDTATVLLRRRGSSADRLVCETLLDLAAARSLDRRRGAALRAADPRTRPRDRP